MAGTPFIGRTVGMLAAINLDDNFCLMTGEVREVRTDRRLPPKMMLLEGRLSQKLPELLFGFGRVTTQGSSAWHAGVNRTRRCLWHAPPPPPPPPPPPSRAEGGGRGCAPRTLIPKRAHRGALARAPPPPPC